MTELICEFCRTKFKNIYTMNNHKNKAKYCLIIQGKLQINDLNLESNIKNSKIIQEKESFTCNYCCKILSSKQNLLNHENVCIEKKNKELKELKELKDLADKEIKEITERSEKELKEKEKININLNSKIDQYDKHINEYKQQIKDLQDKLEKIANKAIDRPTTTNHNTVNNKFELNTFPSQREIDQKIESQFNDKYILDGMKGVAQFVFDHIVKLEDGSMAYACFDTSRQIFKYKDEYGMEIKDPKAVKLRKMIKPGLLRQSKTLLDYFNDECDYLEKRKDNGFDIDNREYSTMNTLREKAFEVGCDILSIEETNKFSSELANLSCF